MGKNTKNCNLKAVLKKNATVVVKVCPKKCLFCIPTNFSPKLFDIFTQIYLLYLRHFATLWLLQQILVTSAPYKCTSVTSVASVALVQHKLNKPGSNKKCGLYQRCQGLGELIHPHQPTGWHTLSLQFNLFIIYLNASQSCKKRKPSTNANPIFDLRQICIDALQFNVFIFYFTRILPPRFPKLYKSPISARLL